GIRDFHVTGVQTCALPIFCASIFSLTPATCRRRSLNRRVPSSSATRINTPQRLVTWSSTLREGQIGAYRLPRRACRRALASTRRSEERRVGEERRCGRRRE